MPTMTNIFILLTSAACIFQLISADEPNQKLSFGVTLGSGTSQTGRLRFTEDVANDDGTYSHTNDFFTTGVDGFYYLFMCIGAEPGSAVAVNQIGGFPSLSYTWQSTDHASAQFGCSGGVTRIRPRASVGLNLEKDSNVYSSLPLRTSWSGFSINGAMKSKGSVLSISCSAESLQTIGPIPLDGVDGYVNPIRPEAEYNSATYTYTCRTAGIYLVSMSVGVAAGEVARVQLITRKPERLTFELTHTRPANNGLVKVSRSVLFNCDEDAEFQLSLQQGQITSGIRPNQELTSLTVVRYDPIIDQAAWALYRNTNWTATGQSETVPFDIVEIAEGVQHQNGQITITKAGNYMVYLSAGTKKDYPANLSLQRNGDTIIGVEALPANVNGVRTLENGIVMPCEVNDVVKVVSLGDTRLYSNVGHQVSFFGFRITE